MRPVREQLEHDRVIRLLQAKYKRKFEVAINPGNEQTMPVGTGPSPWYPDLVLQSTERSRKLLGVVEVETAESVNHLEAMSQWAAFARLRAPLHLYVPAASIDTARRLCTDLQIPVAEIWAFSSLGDKMRFALVHRNAKVPELKGREIPERAPKPAKRAASAVKATNGRAAAKAKKATGTASSRSASKGKPAAKKNSARPAAPRQKATASVKRKRK